MYPYKTSCCVNHFSTCDMRQTWIRSIENGWFLVAGGAAYNAWNCHNCNPPLLCYFGWWAVWQFSQTYRLYGDNNWHNINGITIYYWCNEVSKGPGQTSPWPGQQGRQPWRNPSPSPSPFLRFPFPSLPFPLFPSICSPALPFPVPFLPIIPCFKSS